MNGSPQRQGKLYKIWVSKARDYVLETSANYHIMPNASNAKHRRYPFPCTDDACDFQVILAGGDALVAVVKFLMRATTALQRLSLS